MEDQFFRKTLESVGETSFLIGNSIQVLKDGRLTFEEVFRAVEEAERFICLDFYIFRDDETGWGLAELLARKCGEGVWVCLIYDHFGCLSTSNQFWKFLKSHGAEVHPFHPLQWRNPNLYFHRDHRKLVVIDGRVAFTGGLNVGDEYRGYLRKKLAGWRDTGVKVKGPVDTIGQINQQGCTVLLVEQHFHQALSMAARGYVLERGVVVMEEEGRQLLKNERLKENYLGI